MTKNVDAADRIAPIGMVTRCPRRASPRCTFYLRFAIAHVAREIPPAARLAYRRGPRPGVRGAISTPTGRVVAARAATSGSSAAGSATRNRIAASATAHC